MWELRWAKRTLPSKHWEPALSSLMLSDHRGAQRGGCVVSRLPLHCCKTCPASCGALQRTQRALALPTFTLCFFPFRSLNCIVGGNSEVTAHTQERLRKMSYPHLGLILCTETACKNKNKNNNKTQHTLGKEENLISRVPTL